MAPPAGNVAAFDMDAEGVVSLGGVGFDINCGAPQRPLQPTRRRLATPGPCRGCCPCLHHSTHSTPGVHPRAPPPQACACCAPTFESPTCPAGCASGWQTGCLSASRLAWARRAPSSELAGGRLGASCLLDPDTPARPAWQPCGRPGWSTVAVCVWRGWGVGNGGVGVGGRGVERALGPVRGGCAP